MKTILKKVPSEDVYYNFEEAIDFNKTEVINNSNFYAYIWEDGKWNAYKNGRKITVRTAS